MRVYLKAVEGLPAEALQMSADRFTQGRVEGQNTSFAPSCADFAKDARDQWAKYRRENTPLLPKPEEPQFSSEHRAKMQENLSLLARAVRGDAAAVELLEKGYLK